ncbi:MAG: TIGR00180 family glycosyltransferase [Sediminibacterium sp.]
MLTLLLTLKDRYEFTENILHYFNEVRFKYPILIADGSNPENQKKLKQKISEYSNISLTLQNYPADNCLTDYYNKLKVASGSIHTKYTLLIDNDDYFSEKGCAEAVDFLEQNPSYVAAGQICQFINFNDHIFFANSQVSDFDTENQETRVKNYLDAPLAVWGLIVRTEVNKHAFEMIADCNFQYLHLIEFLFNLYVLTSGKVKYLYNAPCTFRRMITDNSSSMSFIEGEKHYNFYYKDFFYSDWRKCMDTAKTFVEINEKLYEKYWFRGCVNGWNSGSQVMKRKLKSKEFIRGLYYRVKYRKNWSPDVCFFDARFLANRKFNI